MSRPHELEPLYKRWTPARFDARLTRAAKRNTGWRPNPQAPIHIPGRLLPPASASGALSTLVGAFLRRVRQGRRGSALGVLLALLWATPVAAQSAPVTPSLEITAGQSYTASADHDGLLMHEAGAGYRLLDNGVEVAVLSVTALVRPNVCGGIWSIGPNGETRRGGQHVGGGVGSDIRCVDGSAWTLGSNGNWYQLVGGNWQLRTAADPGGTRALEGSFTFPAQTIAVAGSHLIEVEAFTPTKKSARANGLVIQANAAGVIYFGAPTNLRVIPVKK